MAGAGESSLLALPMGEVKVVQKLRHPYTGEWIGVKVTEKMTTEEFAHKYPDLFRRYGSEKVIQIQPKEKV